MDRVIINHSILFIACLMFHVSLFVAALADESHSFSYARKSKEGPENWGSINPEWETCRTGKIQSPIDICSKEAKPLPTLGHLRTTYKPAPALLKNRGHDIMIQWNGEAGGLAINGTEYKLLQCHWHTPSEHTINGKRASMELHLVNISPHAEIAVIGVLYKLGRPDSFLAKFIDKLKTVDEEGTDLGILNPLDTKFGSGKYFRYNGSLTAPPCTEGVVWTIIKKVRTVSKEQINALRNAVYDGFKNNARPTQDLNGRDVYVYQPQSQ